MASDPAPFSLTLRRLGAADIDAAATLHLAAYEAAPPWLAARHDFAATRTFYADTLLPAGPVWGGFRAHELLGIMVLHGGVIDQLYVAPAAQGRGVSSALVDLAKADAAALSLWTFARNTRARRFYEARDFVAVEHSDGERNEEREPDLRYAWTRQ